MPLIGPTLSAKLKSGEITSADQQWLLKMGQDPEFQRLYQAIQNPQDYIAANGRDPRYDFNQYLTKIGLPKGKALDMQGGQIVGLKDRTSGWTIPLAAVAAAATLGVAAFAPAVLGLSGAGGGASAGGGGAAAGGVSAATGAGTGVGVGTGVTAAGAGTGAAAGGTAAASGGLFGGALSASSLIQAGTGLGGAWMAARAQKQASRDQLAATRDANRIAEDAQRRAEAFQREQLDYDRWLQGATAEARRPYLEQAMALMGSGGGYAPEVFQEAAPFVAPTQAEAVNDPGYQATVAEGQKRLEGSAAARGTLNTGGTLKDVQQYGQNMATARYDDVYNRAFNAYTLREQLRGQAYDRNAQAGYQAASLNQSASMGRINDLLALAGMATPGQYPGAGGGGSAFLPKQPDRLIRGADSGARRPWLLPPGVGDPLERRELHYA